MEQRQIQLQNLCTYFGAKFIISSFSTVNHSIRWTSVAEVTGIKAKFYPEISTIVKSATTANQLSSEALAIRKNKQFGNIFWPVPEML